MKRKFEPDQADERRNFVPDKLMEEEKPPLPLATATPASGRKMYEEVSKHKKIAEMRGRSVSSRVEGAAEMRSTSERSGEMRDLENLGRLPQQGPETTFIEVLLQPNFNLLPHT